ncbi:MAG: hypothetical protein QOC87_582 [Actinomycetota bacterium]|jgi:hypothetical protein|nr:hypothetical protein [Actinomycetota bacterium]
MPRVVCWTQKPSPHLVVCRTACCFHCVCEDGQAGRLIEEIAGIDSAGASEPNRLKDLPTPSV